MHRMTRNVLLLVLIYLFLTPPAFAALYQYVDEFGALHFTNVPTDPEFKMIVPPAGMAGTKAVDSRGNRRFSASDFASIVAERSFRHGMDPQLVDAVIRVESEYNPKALSKKGAQGLMQLMPDTARGLGVTDPYDPAQNIDGGVRYLRYLLDFFGWDLDLALAAYNAGIHRVEKNREIPHIVETRNYVTKVKKTYNKKPPTAAALPDRTIIHRVVSASGDVVFTNTPEAYRSY